MIHFLSRLSEIIFGFISPRSRRVLELEALSAEALLNNLPRSEPLKERNTLALFDYSHPVVKEIVWEIKYNGNKKLADKIGEILYDVICEELIDLALFDKWERPILVPIPISDKRRFERGWNQSELLAQAVKARDAEKAFKYLPHQLAKLQHTESQTKTSSRSERLHNLTNSMKVLNPSSIAGRCLIILDDVTTTGATFGEARRALKEAGAKKILCIAIAH